jgi:hypothetical protein
VKCQSLYVKTHETKRREKLEYEGRALRVQAPEAPSLFAQGTLMRKIQRAE